MYIKYLRGGLALGQDYEIICIDDASTDCSLEILTSLKQEGIIVISQEKNQGVSAARNAGLKIAHGELVWFVDADDMVDPKAMSRVWEIYSNSEGRLNGVNIPSCRVSADSVIDNIKRTDSLTSSRVAYNYVVQRTFLQKYNIKFPTGVKYGEDTLFTFQLFINNGIFDRSISEPLYYYRMNPVSAMHTSSPEKHLKGMQGMLIYYCNYLNSHKAHLSKEQIEHIEERIRWSVANICADAVRMDRTSAKKCLLELRTAGFYPYPLLWKRLSLKCGLKSFLVNLFFLPLCFSWYYLMINKIFNCR